MLPIRFAPIYRSYIWGGRTLETLFGRELPEGIIAESWEIVDRPDAQSMVAGGIYKGLTLRELIEKHGREILSEDYDEKRPFPLIVKWLDAKERLSLQVHPPAAKAKELGGEPKTEGWYIREAKEGAGVFAGLKKGVKWENLEKALLQNGATPETQRKFESLLHRLPTKNGDFLFIPSGRLHAIDAGNVILEIQQNSNTTYRVYDWNRNWGRPRELHVEKSLASIDFNDFEPALTPPTPEKEQQLLSHPLFGVKRIRLQKGEEFSFNAQKTAAILTITEGALAPENEYPAGSTFLLPRASACRLSATQPTTLILTTDFL